MTELLALLLGIFATLAWRRSGPDLSTHAPPTRPPRPASGRPRPTPRPATTASSPVPTPGPTPPSPPPTVPVSTPVAIPETKTPPWPQVVPAGLPSFPTGWEPDTPVGSGVAARASELLLELWRYGSGTRKTEQTAGRWITYVATPMGSKRGVVAYRLRPTASPTGATTPVSTSSMALPTLRRGSRGAEVAMLQRQLGLNDDGIYGPQTEAVVRAYQSSHGLTADGVVGRQTWGSLMGGSTVRV
jgi:peptidoglycan hydrolase-like protein with peptidoglycan-binding domain